MQATDSTEDDEYIHPDRHVQQASENGIGMYLDNDEGGAFGFPLDQHLPDEEDAFGGTIHDPSSRVDRVVGHADAVRCFQCGFRLRNWQAGDDPHAIHRQYSRQCDFLRERHGAAHATQEMREVNLHSPRVGSSQSLNNLRIDHLEAILQEWRTPLCREALQAENRRLRQICMCQRCKRKPLEIMLFPCHHRLCNACVGRSTHCPICNAHIWDRLRVFM
ncbi:BIR7B-like protein [Mya arenaria]|uniref:BIR7B-like protein n=1 Tax=Mya arenaria TaxID=6604 RepID=A0ABY7EDJ9_MYAAR|nr:BIR7B-like protein [Mya arenaria]